MNLAKQPFPEFEDSEFEDLEFEDLEKGPQGEANVVEMPNRQVYEPTSARSSTPRTPKRKQGNAAKRKPATTPEKAFSFRQMRDGHQQPYIDELKRLEAQAERINQLLAERKRKKAQAEQAEPSKGASTASPTTSSTKKKATRSSKQTSRSPQREVSPMPAQDDDTAALEAQAERIKQLLKELESALNEGEPLLANEGEPLLANDAIAPESADDPLNATATAPSIQVPTFGIEAVGTSTYRYGPNAQPLNAHSLSMPLEEDPKAQHEAAETAEALRSLASRDGSRGLVGPTNTATHHPEMRRVTRSRASHPGSGFLPVRHYGLRLRQLLQVPHHGFDRIGDAVLWIVLAVVVRVGARFILAMVPALTPIFALLMFAPALLAVYLAMFVPKAGFVSIYRLFLIMLGLLVGGRL